MGRLAVAELILLAVAVSSLVVGLLAFALLILWRRLWNSKCSPPQLPISEPPLPNPKKLRCCKLLRQLLIVLLCSHRRTHVEPAAADSAGSSPAPDAQGGLAAPGPEEDMTMWRERWFGPTSRALYTIDEASTDGKSEDQEPETSFYTQPVSPPRLRSDHSPAAAVEASA